ncbi:hypothetical protein EYW49_15415 [Siculibacillus lacustris]|uniref:Cbb3-type cytochrome c oxidase subunit I n=1 Tax=Siculibacillus lacustris TaxID=1549641 RepID=A0A4V2KT51_9HYPH|nr:hypothetical protein [Siculibacillus lacustris]TBW35782.1 hypothetical protein EYW49_15415 [Siculibacillus lacustris]
MVSKWFLRVAVLFALAGMGLGIFMAAAADHRLSPVHAHVNLIGWVGMFLAGLFYRTHPASEGRAARWHLGTAIVGLTILAPGIAGVHLGLPWGEPLAGIGSLLTLAAMVLFATIVVRGTAAPASEQVDFTAPGRTAAARTA